MTLSKVAQRHAAQMPRSSSGRRTSSSRSGVDAGHGVGYSVPYDPMFVVADGGTSATTELARENFWPIQLAFLAAIP
jgi:hypothetical protein